MGTHQPGRRLGNLPVEGERTEYLTAVQDSRNSKGEGTGFVIQVEGLETSQGGKAMLTDVPLIGIFVDDQEGALDFYTHELGLQKVQDEAYGPDARWITVSPAESKTRIVPKKAERDYEKAMVGSSDGAPVLRLATDDVQFVYDRPRKRGVRFLGEPYRYPWGIGALLLEQDGNPMLLQQEVDEEKLGSDAVASGQDRSFDSG
jgi:lactoylglutathione lyase